MRAFAVAVLLAVSLFPGVAAADHSAPPRNDRVEDATVIPSLPFTDDVDASGATVASDEPDGCISDPRSTLWYRITPQNDVKIDISTVGSHFDTIVEVFRANDLRSPVDCDDDGAGGGETAARLQMDLVAGTTYLLRAAAAFADAGHDQHLRLSVREYEPFTSTHEFGVVAEVADDGEVLIRHGATCNDASESVVRVVLTQGAGSLESTASVEVHPFYCAPAIRGPVESVLDDGYAILTTKASRGSFRPGPVTVQSTVRSCSYGRYQECVRQDISTTALLVPQA